MDQRFYVYASFYNGKRGWYRIRGIDSDGKYIGNFPVGVALKPGIKFCKDYRNGQPVSEQTVKEHFGVKVTQKSNVEAIYGN